MRYADVPHWPGLRASSAGDIYRYHRTGAAVSRWERVVPFTDTDGVLKVDLTNGWGVRSRERVHVLVCWAFHGSPPNPDAVVDHIDGDYANVRADNLRWLRNAHVNTAMAALNGSLAAGETHPKAKLTDAEVVAIRESPLSNRELARMYRVNPSTISRARGSVTRKRMGF